MPKNSFDSFDCVEVFLNRRLILGRYVIEKIFGVQFYSDKNVTSINMKHT